MAAAGKEGHPAGHFGLCAPISFGRHRGTEAAGFPCDGVSEILQVPGHVQYDVLIGPS